MRERCTKVKCQGEDTHTHRLENKVHRVSKRKRQTDRQTDRCRERVKVLHRQALRQAVLQLDNPLH